MPDPLVRTSRGTVRGRRTEHGYLFGAIPYGAPPVGERRYRAPEPAPPWAGALDGSRTAATMPQPARTLPGLRSEPLLGRWDGAPPRLCLNVWTPDPAARGLPVLVWLHGGAFVAGSPALPAYDGRAWMRDGVVLVTVAYRLGVEGFVWLQDGEANVALRDQLLALAWVQEEIAAFGGASSRVCVAGQSAGAICLGLLLGSERSRGLFARAISMSGGVELTLSPTQARTVAAAIAERVGVPPSAAAMREVPLERVFAAQAAITSDQLQLGSAGERDPGAGLVWLLPVRDGELVAEDPLAALGTAGPVGLLAGATSEEGRLYLAGVPGFDSFPEAALEAFAARVAPDGPERVSRYRAERPDCAPGDLAARLITDTAFAEPTARLLARHASIGRTYAYRFAWRSSALGGRLGAAHAVDLPFAFDALRSPGISGAQDTLLGPEGGPQELAAKMHGAWVRFVTDGDPGWQAYPHVQGLEACATVEGQ